MIKVDRAFYKVKNKYELTRLKKIKHYGNEEIKCGYFYQGFINIHAMFEQVMYIAVEQHVLCESVDMNKLNGVRSITYSHLICSKIDKLLDRPFDRCSVNKPNTLLYIYWYSIYPMRNRLVHRGYMLSKEEAIESCRVMEEIIVEIGKRNEYINLKAFSDEVNRTS